MSQAQLIDGLTGELLGGGYSSGGYTANNYTTGNVVNGGYTSNVADYTVSSNINKGYTSTYNSGVVGSTVVQPASYAVGHTQQQSQIVNTTYNTAKEVIKEYKDEARVERVPRTRKVTEYREEKRVEQVPREVTKTDYYAVEYLRQYIPQYVPEKTVEYVAKERKVKKYEYIPVERQIIHYPEDKEPFYKESHYAERSVLPGATKVEHQTISHHIQPHSIVGGHGYTPQEVQINQYGQPTGPIYKGSANYVSGGGKYVSGGSGVYGEQTYISGGSGLQNGQQLAGTYVKGTETYVSGGSGVNKVNYGEEVVNYTTDVYGNRAPSNNFTEEVVNYGN